MPGDIVTWLVIIAAVACTVSLGMMIGGLATASKVADLKLELMECRTAALEHATVGKHLAGALRELLHDIDGWNHKTEYLLDTRAAHLVLADYEACSAQPFGQAASPVRPTKTPKRMPEPSGAPR